MERDRFESGLDTLIAAHGRKVRAGIDAAACGTRTDWHRSHEADDAYLDARDAFLAEVFAAPPPDPLQVPLVVGIVGWEEQGRGRSRGRPLLWRRGIEVRIVARGVTHVFAADADSLTLDAAAVEAGNDSELRAPDFNPLRAGHSIRLWGIDYTTAEDGPDDLVKVAIEACRAVALRLLAHRIDGGAVTRAWAAGGPTFAEIVSGEASMERAA